MESCAPIANRRRFGFHPYRRIANPPQAASLHHKMD